MAKLSKAALKAARAAAAFFGREGGRSTSRRKRETARANLVKARAAKAQQRQAAWQRVLSADDRKERR